jgi:hypothetical protein
MLPSGQRPADQILLHDEEDCPRKSNPLANGLKLNMDHTAMVFVVLRVEGGRPLAPLAHAGHDGHAMIPNFCSKDVKDI